MKKNIFLEIVQNSRALSQEQKELLLADPPLPEGYRKKVAEMLGEFDKRSRSREAYLTDKLEELHTEFIQQIDASDLGENEKKELVEKAKQIKRSMFPDAV